MNRRDLLKGLGALPFASALGCHRPVTWSPPPTPSKVYSLQILIEGAFALVLQYHSNTLLAFVPEPPPDRRELAHDLYFNDPKHPREPGRYHFKLAADGLRPNSREYPDPYVDAGFKDFYDTLENWHLPASLVVLELPFPQSITFSGRPLKSTIKNHAGESRTGFMPTNRILEYFVEDPALVKMSCPELKGRCEPSPHCPPGMLRYFFGVNPVMDSPGHAVNFFNFTMRTAFRELADQYQMIEIERKHSDHGSGPSHDKTAPGDSNDQSNDKPPRMTPAVYDETMQRARLVTVASTVDCQSGGITVNTHTAPTLG
ncbi:MAG: hypothetical protein LAP21_14515 [Acidobacteriia bacterium]|nr:hypothetical protein [Terriglobia bacterium]